MELADVFGVSPATVTRLKALFRETQSVSKRPHGGGRKRVIDEDGAQLLEKLVLAHPDWTEDAYAKALLDLHGITASAASAGRVIRRLGYSVKKSPSSPRSGTNHMSSNVDASIEKASETSPQRVWFLWTRLAPTRR